MQPLQRLIANDGYEVLLFPLEYMYMSQPEGGDFSHLGTYNLDFLGWNSLGRVYQCPYYAPCSCTCIGSTGNDNRIWQSNNQVHLADGSLSVVTWVDAHDDTPPAVGTVLVQGQVMGHTGTTGYVTGDHLHFNMARGAYAGWERVPPNNNWQLVNSMHVYDACFVNDTVIVEGYNYNWITYDEPTPVEDSGANKFPWYIVARRLRQRRTNV